MISKFSCSQPETTGMLPHSNFTWGINSWKSPGKVFIRINPHFLLWFAQVRSRKPSRHPEPLTFLWFSHKYMQRAMQQFKKVSSHYMIAWPYTTHTSRALTSPTHYRICIDLDSPWGKRPHRLSEAHYHISHFQSALLKPPYWPHNCFLLTSEWLLPLAESQLIPFLRIYCDIHLTTAQIINLL